MFRKTILFSFLILNFSMSVFSIGEADYMERAIGKVEKEVKTSTSFEQKALCYQDLEKWFQLLVKLNISNEEKNQILLKTRPNIDYLSEEFQVFPDFFFAGEDVNPISVLYQNEDTTAFSNLDSERYPQEIASYNENKSFEIIEVTIESLTTLKAETHYNFVITLEGKFLCSELQEYDEIFIDDKKILLAPNHAILASGEPVIAAGEFKIIGDKFPFYWIALTSGHYHPLPKAKKHVESKFAEWNVPLEHTIILGFHLHKLGWKFLDDSANTVDY